MKAPIRWGILSTGRIAGQFARGLALSQTGTLAAVGSRNEASADAFAAAHGAARAHASYEALLADAEVDVVYIATPHPMHCEWTIAAARAGKHILCEKPIGMNASETEQMIEAARANDVFLMEAFMYRCHPQTDAILALVRSGAIGEVKLVEASFGFRAAFDPAGRLFNPALGGGAILDIGCYPVSFARLIAGEEPTEWRASGTIGDTGVDEYAQAQLQFPSGMRANLTCSIAMFLDNHARVFGTEGWIEVPWPWAPAKHGGTYTIRIHRPVRGGAETVEEITKSCDLPLYTVEADTVARHLADREAPAMPWQDSLGNMRTLDRWLHEIGLQ